MPDLQLPTAEQLGVRPSTLVRRGLLLQCPACGQRGVISGWFGILDRCPTCDLRIERIEGHWIGSFGLNVVVCFTATFLVLLTATLLSVPDIRPLPIIIAAVVPAALGPVLFAPGSRTTWVAIDLLMRPLTPGEIDPRFVKVDPRRDRPTKPQA